MVYRFLFCRSEFTFTKYTGDVYWRLGHFGGAETEFTAGVC